jgi:hypothetical protein
MINTLAKPITRPSPNTNKLLKAMQLQILIETAKGNHIGKAKKQLEHQPGQQPH